MNRLFKLSLVAAIGLFFVGCYNDFDNPKPAPIYTDADFEAEGLEYISIKDLKARFRAETPGKGDGDAASWDVTEPLYTKGKVISTDRYGNVYKTVYIYDQDTETAIEVRLNTGNYISYPPGRVIFVKLQGLTLGNYRGMISIGRKDTAVGTDYANANIEDAKMIRDHILWGEDLPLLQSDTLVVNRSNYQTVLSDDALGRLVRFEDITSVFGKAPWGYGNTFPNYFLSASGSPTGVAMTFDKDTSGFEYLDPESPAYDPEKVTWALKYVISNKELSLYGSTWISYDPTLTSEDSNNNIPKGNYVIRTSGYSRFWNGIVPPDGAIMDVTAIYTKFTNGGGMFVTYQLTLNNAEDVVKR